MSNNGKVRLNDGQGLQIAHEEDFGIKRNEQSELLPVMQRIPGTDMAIKCIPLSPGQRSEYADVFDQPDAPEERIAELWNEHIVEGIGKDVDPADIGGKDGIPFGIVSGINQALKNSSAVEIFLAVQEQQSEEVGSNMKVLNKIGDDNLEALLDSVDSDELLSQK